MSVQVRPSHIPPSPINVCKNKRSSNSGLPQLRKSKEPDLFCSPIFEPVQDNDEWEPAVPLCRFHLKKGGSCNVGSECKFRHPSHVREVRGNVSAVGVCRYYLSATCRDGETCPMRHLVECSPSDSGAESLHHVRTKKSSASPSKEVAM